jgi:hypothetical protein
MKGIASEDTKRIITRNARDKEEEHIPEKFWCYDELSCDEHCCFWHYIFFPNGGPERDGFHHPLYEYEIQILEYLEEGRIDSAKRLIAVYKATGLGITEFILLWILWRSCVDPYFQNKEAVIITGPNVDLAKGLIIRCKKFARGRVSYVDLGSYGLKVRDAVIKCYPSNNMDSARGLPKVSVFFGDEVAFFSLADDTQVRKIGERYIAKSDAYIIWVSTAGDEASGFFYILKDENPSNYKRFHFYEDAGLKKNPVTHTSIFKKEQIEESRKLDSHAQEYMGVWGHNVGDIYSQEAIDEITSDDYEINPSDMEMNRVGFCDPAFGTSKFGIVITETRNRIIHVIYSKSYERKSSAQMINELKRLRDEYHVRTWGCDAANPEIIKAMREEIYLSTTGVDYRTKGKKLVEVGAETVAKRKVRIHPIFLNLKKQIMAIKYDKNGKPKKTNSNPFDEGDAFNGNLYLRKHGGGYVSISTEQEDFETDQWSE